MDNAKHTSGPWEVSGNCIWTFSPWNARFKLATVTMPSPMNGVDWQANANLIAAAPDLCALAECQAAIDLPNAECASVLKRHGWNSEPLSAWMSAFARKVLAKARGESEAT